MPIIRSIISRIWPILSVLILILIAQFIPVNGQNHLEPIDDYSAIPELQTYHNQVNKILIKDKEPLAYLIVLPSFSPEYALILREVRAKDTDSIYYEIESAVAEEQIWNVNITSRGRLKLKLRKNTKIIRQTAEIPEDLAQDIIKTWKAVLMKTRPPDKNLGRMDGVNYEFHLALGLAGKTWSPESGLPKMMVESGELLIEYIKAPEEERPVRIEKLRNLCEQIRAAN